MVAEHVSLAQPDHARPRESAFAQLRERYRKSNKWAYVFIAPLLLDFAVFTVYMAVRVVTLSFQDLTYGKTTWVGWKHYTLTLSDPQFWNAIKNTLTYGVFVIIVGILVALVLSEFIFRRSQKLQVFFKSALYLPSVVSTVVLAIVWTWIYQPFNGILNFLVGLGGAPAVNWLSNPQTAMGAIIFMSLVSGIGVSVVFLTAAMGGIPTELYDAAKIDGASEWGRFLKVTVPLLRPTILYLSVVGFIGAFQVFEQIYVMTQGGPGFPGATETVGFLIYSSAFTSFNFGRSAAESILLFLIILVFSVVQFRIFASEVEY